MATSKEPRTPKAVSRKIIIEYHLKLETDLLGSIPKSKDVFENYLATRNANAARAVDLRNRGLTPKQIAEELNDVEDFSAPAELGFFRDDTGIHIFDYQLRGLLREAANNNQELHNIAMYRSKITNTVFVSPRILRFHNPDGSLVTEPHGSNTRPLRAMTAQGPRVTIVKSDYIAAGCTLNFDCTILPNAHGIDVLKVNQLWEFGAYQGLLQWRTGGFGRFTITSGMMRNA